MLCTIGSDPSYEGRMVQDQDYERRGERRQEGQFLFDAGSETRRRDFRFDHIQANSTQRRLRFGAGIIPLSERTDYQDIVTTRDFTDHAATETTAGTATSTSEAVTADTRVFYLDAATISPFTNYAIRSFPGKPMQAARRNMARLQPIRCSGIRCGGYLAFDETRRGGIRHLGHALYEEVSDVEEQTAPVMLASGGGAFLEPLSCQAQGQWKVESPEQPFTDDFAGFLHHPRQCEKRHACRRPAP